MNQGRFRLVFSGLHGMMMAVAEFVSAQGKAEAAVDRSAPASAHESSDTPWFATRKSTFAALCLFGLQPLLIDEAHAQATLPVTPDRNASGAHPVVSVAGNGVPVVNIVAPNAAGTSHNKYTDYNVGQKGLVLNNSGQNSQTQTAGWVQGNPFMGNQSARTILNEVTSGNRSQLLGMTEVAGRAANVVIANPAGIYCNGCGFIAAPRVTLTTGVPVLDANGALSRLNVMQGGITIDGQGLDTRGASQTDLIARAMEINGQIWAQQLNATAGAIQVNYTDGGATPIPGTGARPVVAIDVSALGSMYGNNAVRLVGTELGVGVNLGGMLNSLTGDIQVASNGDVTITPKGALLAANNAQVSATSITNAGTVASDGNVALIATQALTNVGTVTARTNLGGTGQSVANSGTLAGGIATDGTVNAAGSVSVIASGVLQNSGTIQGGQNALVQAANGDLSNGSIHAGKVATLAVAGDVLHTNATLDAPSLDVRVGGTLTNQHGSIASQAPLNLTVGALDNRSGVVSSQGSLDIDTANVQNAGGQLVAQQDIAVHASNIGNQGGTIGSVTGAAAVSANALDNSSGTISAAQASSVTASNLTNAQGQISGDWVNVAADSLDTQGGKIVAVHDARVSATGNLDNSAGTIGSQQSNASITAGGVLANVGGTIASAGNITTQAQSLDNSSGIISAGQTLNVTASNLTNASGQMSGDQVNVAARTLDTHAGQIIAIHDVTISASGELNNAAGTIGSQQGETSVAAGGALSNASGTITSRGGTNVSANALDNSNGIVNAARQTAIRAVNVTNANGQIGGDTVSVAASSVDTRGGKIVAVHDVTVTASGDLNNAAGTIGSQQGNATVSAGGALSNTNGGLIASADNTTLAARSIDNTAGAISAAHALTLDGPLTSNAGGELSGDTVDLHVDGILNNRAGRIVGTRVSDIDGAISVDNTGGTLGTALGDFSLTVNGAIANTGGTIASGGNSTVSAQSFDNTDGRFAAANRATLSANSATNTRGQISGNAVQVDVADALNNASGQIASASTVRLKAANIDNTSGQISAQDVRVKTGRLTNDQGAIIAGNTLALDTAWISNRAGTVTSAGTAKISSSNDIDNTNGTLAANDTATITASSLGNAGGVLGSVNGALTVNTTGALNNDTGTLASAVDTTLNAHALTNHGGTISGRSVAVTTQTADNSNGAIVGTAGNVSIDAAQGLTNTQGLVQAAVALNVDTHGAALDNRSGLITGATQVNVNAGQLDNRDHGAISSADTLAVHAANLVNDTGSITAQNALNVSADGTLSNRGGTLGSNGVATLSADSVDNDAGLIHAGGALTINARAISNTNTNAASRGIEGATVTLATVVLDNTQGAIRSDQSTAIGTGTLNNSQGEIASGGALDLVASGDVTNTQGDLNGGTHTNVTAHEVTGDGTIQSQGDVNLSLQSDFNNTGSVQADHDVNVNTSGDIANSGSITAGNALTVAGQNVTNTAAGVIAGQASTHVIAAHSVNNDGLINGGDTRIDAQAVTNTGRIYGDSIAVSAGTLDNDINGEGTAGVLASRGDIDLGVGTLTNREGAYILANNDLRIAGALDASGHANRDTTGNARQVTNDSATIEAGGNLTIDAARVDNLNSHFATATTTTTSTAPQFYYMQPGSDVLLGAADTWFYLNESNHLHALMPGTINPKDAWHSQTEYWAMLLPSTQYPQARYGPPFNYDGDTTPNRNGEDVQLGKGLHSIPYAVSAGGKFWTTAYPVGLAYSPETTYQTGAGDNVQTITAPEAFAYTPDNPIWAVFGVSPPAALVPEPANACAPGDRTCNASFTAQHDAWQSAHAAAVVQYQALNDAIAAFDTDFSSRLVSNFDMVTVNSQTTTEDSVTYSAPGQILAGGNLSINGSLNNDKSQIAAGGDFNGTGAQTINADALGVKQTIAQGTMTASIAQGGGRQWTSDQPFSKTLDDQVIHLSIAPTTASVTPGAMRSVFVTSATAQGAGGAVDIASGTAQGAALNGVNGAASIDGVNVATSTAGAVAAPGAIALDPSGASATAATPVSTGPTAPLGGEVIRTMTPPLRLPNNALYRTQSDPGSHYLIETDPAYANFKTWISSDTMIRALNQSPDNVIKRIGDGFYEQQLVAQQVLTLTGQRFVGDYTSNEAEYKALLNGGVQAGQAFGLTIGTALTDAQMAALTSDIVWLVKQTVTLADGSTQEVLTPQVYLHARDMYVTGTGALIAGKNVSIQNSGDVNNSGTIASRGVTIVTGENISNVNGTLSGSTLIAHANTDLTNLAGRIVADNALLTAGRDINISSQSWSATGLNTATSGLGALSTINAGNLAIGAGHDLTITASALNATGNLALAAVNDVNLKTLTVSDSSQSTWDSKNQRGVSASTDVGASINAGGGVSIAAGHDVNTTAANVVAAQALNVAAGNDINLNAGQQSRSVSEDHYSEAHGFLSRTKTTTQDANASTDAIGTTLSGDTVSVAAGHDLTARAATIAGTGDVNLSAGNNLTITTAATSSLDAHSKETKKSGFGSGGGLSFGTSSQKDTSHDTVAGEQGSLIGSTDGSVHMQAGSTLHVTGSDIVAAQDVTGVAANVVIDGSQTNRHHDETHESRTTGFSITASAPVIDAAQNTLRQASSGARSQDDRASALHVMAAASGAYDAAGAANGAAQDLAAGKMPDAKIELSWGSSSSKSTFTQDSSNTTGSTVKAGGTAAFVATGGNVDIAGSDVNASNVILSAANQVNLTNSTDTNSTRSTNESKSAGVGVSVGTGGIGVDASMSKAHGNANSDSTASNNTHINAANNATIISGGDTNLIGANVNGKSVSMDVGGNLNIASTQDTSTSAAKQDSTGGGIAISAGGASGSFNHSSGRANGNYAGVTEQTGIHAGTDGFDITVKGGTDLKGGLIASDATPDKNMLTTGTLTFSDIQNSSSYDAKSSGFGGGASTGNGGNTYATHGNTSGSNTGGIAPMLSQNDSGSDGATTRSAVSAGTINVTDQANQTQDVASLSRNTSNTNGTVRKTPDANNLLDKQSDMMSATSVAGEAVARRIGDYADAQAKATGDPAWTEGGAARAEMQAAGAALVGGLGGGVASAAGSAAGAGLASISASRLNALSDSIANSSPTGNADIDRTLGNIVANVIATGAGAAVGGGAGATSAANVDHYNRQLHPEEKQWIKTNAAAYAKQNGITVDQAVSALTAQADRQVQSGSSGAWDQSASAFLSQAHGMLPADGNSGPGYMFYATPDQKANLNMYAGYYPKGAGLNKPAAADIAGSANYDAASRDALAKQTWGAAAAAGGLALAGPVAALPGAPILSSGGALGSGTWASPLGTGAISAGINAGSQYYQNRTVNPVDVGMAALSGGFGAYGGLAWNIGVNAIGGATGTAINNAVYGKNDSVIGAGVTSGGLSVVGYSTGKLAESWINSSLRPTISNASEWAASGSWSGSGWNFIRPNSMGAIGGAIGGGAAQESIGPMLPVPSNGGKK